MVIDYNGRETESSQLLGQLTFLPGGGDEGGKAMSEHEYTHTCIAIKFCRGFLPSSSTVELCCLLSHF